MRARDINRPTMLERYRDMMVALHEDSCDWDAITWMRVAGQVAVIRDDPATDIAAAIRVTACDLDALADWFIDFASPARFAIAALLVQHRIPLREFVSWRLQTTALLAEVGIACDPFNLTLTALLLNLKPVPGEIGKHAAYRLKEIHDRMKRLHRWLIGPGDLPAFAALAQCPGSPEVITARIEAAYQAMTGDGMLPGHELQTAANLLMLAGVSADDAVGRFREIRDLLDLREWPTDPSQYGSIAVMTLLDYPADLLVPRFLSMRSGLDQIDQDLRRAPHLALIATDLTYIDILTAGGAHAFGAPDEQPERERALHALSLATVVMISQIDRELVDARGIGAGQGWPIGS